MQKVIISSTTGSQTEYTAATTQVTGSVFIMQMPDEKTTVLIPLSNIAGIIAQEEEDAPGSTETQTPDPVV